MFRRIKEDPGHISVLLFADKTKLSKTNETTLSHSFLFSNESQEDAKEYD